jgi:hypothetical protein
MSKGNSKSNNKSNGKSNGNGNGNSNGFLISENQNPEISAASTASLSRTFYVSLDNADKVIEGAPFFAFCAKSGSNAAPAAQSSTVPRTRGSSSHRADVPLY